MFKNISCGINSGTGVTVRKYFQFIYLKNSGTRAGAYCVFIERKRQRAASRYHRYYTFTLAVFTAADLSSPSHRVPLFTPRVHAPVLNIRIEKMFRWRKTFVVEQYSRNKFLDNECRPKTSPRRKKANYGILGSSRAM